MGGNAAVRYPATSAHPSSESAMASQMQPSSRSVGYKSYGRPPLFPRTFSVGHQQAEAFHPIPSPLPNIPLHSLPLLFSVPGWTLRKFLILIQSETLLVVTHYTPFPNKSTI